MDILFKPYRNIVQAQDIVSVNGNSGIACPLPSGHYYERIVYKPQSFFIYHEHAPIADDDAVCELAGEASAVIVVTKRDLVLQQVQ